MAENLRPRIKELEENVKLKDNILASLQAGKVVSDSKSETLEKRVRELETENLKLSKNISKLQIERPKIPSARLITSFRDALDDMQVSLESRKGKTKYLVSDVNISLKANVSYEGDQIHFQLPKLDDIISPDNLSTVNFRIKSMPEIREDIFGYEEVMDLTGMNIEKGEDLIIEKGFKVGEVEYRYTERIEPDMIVGQMPSPFSLAPPGSLIDLAVSKRAMVEVPNFLGLSLDKAKKVFESAELTVGDISERVSESPEGTVISQSIKAGEEVHHGTSIDLVIAKKRRAKEKEGESIREIAGIGTYHSDKLDKIGVKTTRELASTPTTVIRKATGVPEVVAEEWKSMASIHNKEMGKYGAYLLVRTGIKSVEDLKSADSSKLYRKLKNAMIRRKVRVPPGFTLSEEEVSRWIESAREG
ncbi:MAG: DUF4332 domain-containing protein [Nitrospiraceae bacterium]|nr:DUF4332 domain-containing protein [Nitrospiraceae bacterium]